MVDVSGDLGGALRAVHEHAVVPAAHIRTVRKGRNSGRQSASSDKSNNGRAVEKGAARYRSSRVRCGVSIHGGSFASVVENTLHRMRAAC
jgi:hypothetical protein